MVRGLLIRQVLTAVNLLLAVGIAYVIYLIGVQQFGTVKAPAALDLDVTDAEIEIAKVKPREEYNQIVTAGLFGDAGKTVAPPPVEEPTEPVLVQTTAPLKLLATVASYPEDPLATAIIENPQSTSPVKVSTYYHGQEVMPGLSLVEVHRRRVILHNAAKNQNEVLTMAAPGTGTSSSKASLPGRRDGRGGSERGGDNPNHVSLERQAVLDEVNNYNYTDLIAELNPQLVEDDNGNIIGISSATLENIPLAQSAGLKNNDVIQSVNGMNIDSEQKIGEIAQRIGNANTIRLSIMREGKPQTLTIKVE